MSFDQFRYASTQRDQDNVAVVCANFIGNAQLRFLYG